MDFETSTVLREWIASRRKASTTNKPLSPSPSSSISSSILSSVPKNKSSSVSVPPPTEQTSTKHTSTEQPSSTLPYIVMAAIALGCCWKGYSYYQTFYCSDYTASHRPEFVEQVKWKAQQELILVFIATVLALLYIHRNYV